MIHGIQKSSHEKTLRITSDGPQGILKQLDDIQELVDQAEVNLNFVDASSQQQARQLRLLEKVIDGLAIHTENDELLADAMQQVAEITGTQEVWIIEASSNDALGVVHMLGELVVGSSDLPDHISKLCRDIFVQNPLPDQLKVQNPDCSTTSVMPILMNQRYFGSLVYTTQPQAIQPIANEVRDRLLKSILRFVAVSVENRHFIESLNEMVIEVVCGFSLAIESRDAYTGGHVQRVTAYALHLAQALGLPDEEQSILRLGGLLHDIGKVAIPDHILNKDSKLTVEEYDIIKAHTTVGHAILKRIPHLGRANQIVRHHHERWDGAGYPDKLKGEDIPKLSRVLAIADSFDAMTSDRSYRKTKTHEEAMAEIQLCAGHQFDPEIAEVFCKFSKDELLNCEKAMHAWIQSKDHGDGLSLDQLIAMKKPVMDYAT